MVAGTFRSRKVYFIWCSRRRYSQHFHGVNGVWCTRGVVPVQCGYLHLSSSIACIYAYNDALLSYLNIDLIVAITEK